ncbi:CT20 family protein [Phlyctema vagabunda]|uniref:CT20 family protein n=1 Tax=Phlyctema vagabunda TaxID=108571 RepID=A0ABR4P5F4_9HELO
MPPRKKAKGAAAVSTPVADESATAADSPQVDDSEKPAYDILKDPWTDEQETSLFKGIIRWKPAGMHKHFRMIALSEYLRNHGYDPKVDTHTRIPGIWEKLSTLYNMEVIDERENSFDYDEVPEERYLEFKLPADEYEDMMWMRGRTSASGSSPPRMHERSTRSPSLPAPAIKKRKRGEPAVTNRASTVTDTDEPQTSPAHSPAPKITRSARSARSNGKAKVESSSRAQSKDTTIDEDADDGDGDESRDGTQDGEGESTASPKPAKSSSKSRSGTATKTQGTTRKSGRKR